MRLRPRPRWTLRAVANEDGLQGLAEAWNEFPDTYVFRRSAKNAAAFFEYAFMYGMEFYVVPVEEVEKVGHHDKGYSLAVVPHMYDEDDCPNLPHTNSPCALCGHR